MSRHISLFGRIKDWVKSNNSKDEELFRDCIRDGPASHEVVSFLIEGLNSENLSHQRRAAECLQCVYPATRAIEALSRALESPDSDVCLHAIRALAGMYPAPVGALTPLLQLTSENADVRGGLTAALGNLARACPETGDKLLEACNDTEARVREIAAWWIGKMLPSSQRGVEGLVELLSDDSPGVRAAAAEAIGECDKNLSSPVVDQLIELFDDEDDNVRDRAEIAICFIEPNDNQLVRLVQRVGSNQTVGRYEVSDLLMRFSKRLKSAEQQLFDVLKVPDQPEDVTEHILMTLTGMPLESGRVGELMELFEDSRFTFRVAEVLLQLGTDGLPTILQILQSPVSDRFEDVCQAINFLHLGEEPLVMQPLSNQTADSVLPPLIDALTHSDARIRERASYGIGGLGSLAASAADSVGCLIDDTSDDVRIQAIDTLGDIGTPEACSKILAVLDDNGTDIRVAVADALGSCRDAQSVSALVRLLDDPDETVQKSALYSLICCGADALPAIGKCRDLLFVQNAIIRMEAARVIASIGPNAIDAESDLCAALRTFARNHHSILMALASIGACSSEAVEAFISEMSCLDWEVRCAALEGVAKAAAHQPELWQHVVPCTNDWHQEIRELAQKLLDERNTG
jgi:HEAT repeat protein